MHRISIVFAALAVLALGLPTTAQQTVILNVVTAGDQNMVDYVKDYLGPMFEKEHPGVTVRAVGTGPGDVGSQKIYEKLEAEKGNAAWDIDVAVIHQKAAGEMVGKGLLAHYVAEIPTGNLVTSEAARNALGADVGGYVMPMFNSQTAIAYNTAMVTDPPGDRPSASAACRATRTTVMRCWPRLTGWRRWNGAALASSSATTRSSGTQYRKRRSRSHSVDRRSCSAKANIAQRRRNHVLRSAVRTC